jgi:hypothetical protein
MDNGYGYENEEGSSNTSKNTGGAIITVVVIFVVISMFCCMPFFRSAFELLLSYKTEIIDELKEYDTDVTAVVADVKEKDFGEDGVKYSYTYEYEYNGQKYRSTYPEDLGKQYRSKGDTAEIKIKSSSPEELYDPDCLKDVMKVHRIVFIVCVAIVAVPVIFFAVIIILIIRSSRRKKQQALQTAAEDPYGTEYYDPNDDYRG